MRCFETTDIMVLCMSLILIHMSYRFFNIILLFQSRCSGKRVVALINKVIIVNYLLGTSIASLTSLLSRVSEMFQNYEHYGLLYVRVINTHVIPFFLYYFVVPFALF